MINATCLTKDCYSSRHTNKPNFDWTEPKSNCPTQCFGSNCFSCKTRPALLPAENRPFRPLDQSASAVLGVTHPPLPLFRQRLRGYRVQLLKTDCPLSKRTSKYAVSRFLSGSTSNCTQRYQNQDPSIIPIENVEKKVLFHKH